MTGGRGALTSGGLSNGRGLSRVGLSDGILTLSEKSVIEVAVPNNLVGAILGIRGSKIAEITAVSGANIKVSDKNDFVEGTTNRLVTITGSPVAAQTAHTLILHKIRQEARDQQKEEGGR